MALVGSAYVNWMDSDLCRSGMTGYNPHVQQEGRNRHRTFSFKAIDKALADRGRRCHVARPDAQFMDVSTCSATRHPTAPSLGLLRIGTRRRKQVQAAKGFRTDRQHSWHRTIEKSEMGHDLPIWKRHDHGSFTPRTDELSGPRERQVRANSCRNCHPCLPARRVIALAS